MGTQTRSFGTSKREGHDSSQFYSRKLFYKQSTAQNGEVKNKKKNDNSINPSTEHYNQDNNKINPKYLDKIFCKSSEKMEELPNSSIHLVVTSPPYNVGKDYDQDLSIEQYRSLLKAVFKETYRVLSDDGGRVCINVANLGRKPYIPLHSYIIQDMLEIGFLMRGEIIWNKAASAGTSTAWGSWQSASNPTLRDVHEYILVFCKRNFSRSSSSAIQHNNKNNNNKKENTITKDEFLNFTKSIWVFPAESAKRVGHPAPFPLELPYRCIQLYTFKGDVVLDPFCGVGTTCLAAAKLGRSYIGYDTDQGYVDTAIKRIERSLTQTNLSQFSEAARLIDSTSKVRLSF
jgi:site-specific DNA-methyltransferase (adenine-specific)